MEYVTKYKSIYDILFKQRNILIDTFMVMISVIFLAVTAQIRIPLWPVPITMQTFGVFLIAFFFGSRNGALSILAYILAGLVGFGVFASQKSGIAAITGPTGGYILGFIACVYVVGLMIERGYGRTKKSVFLCMVVGNVIIYTFGLIGLRLYLGNIGLWKILMAGLIPFLIGDAIKILAAVGLFPYLWKGSEKLVSY
ncbi:biotin transporter BioY [Candidatus Woesearchaeota archaeon]|nr:biotin transporter BioY [Candidatus Woesearchaeota archaeon]